MFPVIGIILIVGEILLMVYTDGGFLEEILRPLMIIVGLFIPILIIPMWQSINDYTRKLALYEVTENIKYYTIEKTLDQLVIIGNDFTLTFQTASMYNRITEDNLIKIKTYYADGHHTTIYGVQFEEEG